jgi:hypothetical protein
MKKEYIILIALIIGLGAYLGLKKEDRVHYELPVVAAVDTDKIDRLEITKDAISVTLNKTGDNWTLTDKKFPADPSAIESILDTVRDLKLSALVSEAGDLLRYELDPPNAVKVKAFAGPDEKRAFTIGKTAPSFNHTYIILAGDKKIYQADKSFRNNFDKSVDDLRDKLIFEAKTEAITTLTLEKEGKSVILTKAVPALGLAENQDENPTENKDQPNEEDKQKTADQEAAVWQLADGGQADQEAAANLLSSLSRLECTSFLSDPEAAALKKEVPLCKITLENDQVLSLNLFQQNGKEDMAGKASSTPYPFSLASYKANDIVSYVDKLLGIEKTEESGPDKE